MRGFNQGSVIPKRNLFNVKPMRFNLIVKLRQDKEPETVILPESAKRFRDSTRGWIGTIMAVGASIPKMKKLVGKIKGGVVCAFDESVSIDDPNRCFDWGDDRFVMMDVETVMGIIPRGKELPEMLGDRVLVRRAKKEDFKITQSKLWIPAGQEKQEVGGVVVACGPGLYNPQRERHLPMEFKPGEFVLFPKYGATDLKIGDAEYAVVRQDKILATVEGEADSIQFA